MNIYSNSFFHRVKCHTIIKNILAEGFKAFYCKEEIYAGKHTPSTYIGIPMVSFCDIPLVHVATNNYGKCGLAMSRRWGRSHHLEPVLYYPNDIRCQSTKMIMNAADNFVNNRSNCDTYRILGYAKPMIKPTREEGQSSDNYAEREWRKVYANPAPLKWLTADEYHTYRGDARLPKKPVGTPLHFEVSDINFILIDRPHMKTLQEFIMNELEYVGGDKNPITTDDKWMLLSKLLVYEDLVNNL